LSLSEEKSVIWEISNPHFGAQEDKEEDLGSEDECGRLVP